MGLGKVQEGGAIFLSVAGGYIWDRKQGKDHECYAEQEFERQDKTTGTRAGAQYGDLTGRVGKVAFRTHVEYGESINVTFVDSDGESYILSISTNNRYSQDLMKALINMDLEKPLYLRPYDFVGSDKRRAQGITFKQDGEKLDLKVEVPAEFTKDEAWFKKAEKKQIKRFFEDLNEWYVAEVEEKVVPFIKAIEPVEKEEKEEPKSAPKKEENATPAVSILTMKKAIRAYISENYEGRELPDLSKEDLKKWFDLVNAEEELPFDEEETVNETSETNEGELSEEDLDSQLAGLMED